MTILTVVAIAIALVSIAGDIWFWRRLAKAKRATVGSVADRLRAEKETSELRSFSLALLDSLPDVFYVFSLPDYRLIQWNRHFETAFGYSHGECRDLPLDRLFPPDSPAAIVPVKNAIENGETLARQFNLVAKDGTVSPYLITGVRFQAADRAFLVGVGFDMTERIAAENELYRLNEELEERVAERTKSLSKAIAALEESFRELNLTHQNQLFTEKMAVLGRLVIGLAHELNTPLGAILSARESSSRAAAEIAGMLTLYRDLDDDETEIFQALLGYVLAEKHVRDRSAVRKLRRLYASVLEIAGFSDSDQLSEKLLDFGFDGTMRDLAVLTRSRRLPDIINMAYSISTLLISNYVIATAAEKAVKTVKALNTYSRQTSSAEPEAVDLRSRLEIVLTLLHSQMKAGVEVIRDYGEIPPVVCQGDLIDQVLVNLINNACQAMEYQGRLELETRLENGRVRVSVIDHGPGISEENQGKIFTPFFTTKPPGEGTGLGLDICKRILDSMDADIDFNSRPGLTSFNIRFDVSSAKTPTAKTGAAWP